MWPICYYGTDVTFSPPSAGTSRKPTENQRGRSKKEETVSVSNDFEATAIPNPTTGITRLEFSADFTGTIQLTSITGRSVRTFTAEETNKLSVNLSTIAPGLYLYLVSDEQGRSVYLGKIVVQ